MTTVNLIIDPPADGAWNMAMDEALLELASDEGATFLRFYQWSEPTLSLGYFQRHADRAGHAASRDCPMVRRATGGGAILHDHELTYSFATPVKDRAGADVYGLYTLFHETFVQTLAEHWGAQAARCARQDSRGNAAGPNPHAEPFLCFQRRAEGDVVLQGHKILGSAQRRRHGAVLQHGSVLLERSSRAPELEGAREVAEVAVSPGELAAQWTTRLAARFGLDPIAWNPPISLISRARTLQSDRFLDKKWNFKR